MIDTAFVDFGKTILSHRQKARLVEVDDTYELNEGQ